MNSTLKDIELDFFELKYFLEYIEENPNDARLQQVASRALTNLASRIELLQDSFNKSYPQNNESKIIGVKAHPSKEETQPKNLATPVHIEVVDTSSHQEASPNQQHIGEDSTTDLSQLDSNIINAKAEKTNNDNLEIEESDQQLPPPLPLAEEDANSTTEIHVPTEIGSLYKALSLNDVFYYTRELFNGDSIAFKEAIRNIEALGNYNKAYQFIISKFHGDLESPAFLSFDEFLKNYYNI